MTTQSSSSDTPHSALRVPHSVVVGGTVAIDNVKTPGAEAENLLGGSASYAALASSFYCPSVHLVGIVGKDFPGEHLSMLESRGISLDGIERSDGESFTWSGEYMENMNERVTHRVGLNVLESWEVSVPAPANEASIVVLANMSPDNQLQMLSQCGLRNAECGMEETKGSSPEASASQTPDSALRTPHSFVIADTMDLWIEIANERLHEVLKRLDLFVINESEARDFTKTSNLVLAGRRLLEKGPRFVVIKLGEFGAMLFGRRDGSIPDELCPDSFFRCAAFPLSEIADPTGAGDTFLGAIAGFLANNGEVDPSFESIREAVVQGSVLASFTCEAFSTKRLEGLSRSDLDARLAAFQQMSSW